MNEKQYKKTAALYIRVSTDKQEELSPQSQKDKLLEYAAQNGYLVPEEFIFWEIGISGRKADKRPQFQRMIAVAKDRQHPFDAILVWKFSRFARNQEESIVYKSMLRKDKVEVISVSEHISDDVFGKLIERIIEWMDEYYSIRLSGDVFRGMSKKAQLGGYQASPPLGYRIAVKGQPPVIDPENAKTIVSIFQMYVDERMSTYAIAVKLNEMGLCTKSGNSFQKRSVEYILKNIHYCGYIRWNTTDNTTKQPKDESEWIVAKGNFEPIISPELYYAATERLNQERPPRKSKPVCQQKHWLSGMVKCSACGRSLTICCHTQKNSGKKSLYLQCYGYHKGLCSVSHYISMEKLEPLVLAGIRSAYCSGNFDYQFTHKTDTLQIETELLLSQLEKIEEKEHRIKNIYLHGIDSLVEYEKKRTELNKESQQLRLLLKNTELEKEKKESINIFPEKITDAASVLTSDNFSNDQKANAVRRILEKVVFQKEADRVELYFRFPVHH